MIFTETRLKGVFVIELEKLQDQRGFFALSWSAEEFARHGLNPCLVQCNISFNHQKGTLRGMHYQRPPYAQAKLVRSTMGAAYDVAVDLRPESPTFRQWTAIELTAESRRMIYIPEGFAHGFQTLTDHTEIFYGMSGPYAPDYAEGVRWNDPILGIVWPETEELVINERDRTYPLLQMEAGA